MRKLYDLFIGKSLAFLTLPLFFHHLHSRSYDLIRTSENLQNLKISTYLVLSKRHILYTYMSFVSHEMEDMIIMVSCMSYL